MMKMENLLNVELHSREMFNNLLKPIVDKCISLCDKAIKESKITSAHINKINGRWHDTNPTIRMV